MSDTIAAIATPPGEGGISLIRLSGKDAPAIAGRLFHPAGEKPLPEFSPQRVYFGEVRDPASGDCVDEVLLTYFKTPRSYTAEEVVEISAHGGMYVSSKILQLALAQGARLAEPGEFTRRAFLNGRIDLSQAEAVADLIAAVSDKALRSAVWQLKGRLSRHLNDLYDRLLDVLAQLEAAIDFPEEGLQLQKRDELKQQLLDIKRDLDKLADSYRQGKIVREGARVALVGKPNAGKSSLLNALLQEDRAIVTPVPGTTRDTLEERVRIRDMHINIIDSAGLRRHPEIIEKEGIQRTRAALERADLVLVIFDLSQPLDANDDLLIQEVADRRRIVVLNKCDLPQKLDTATLEARLPGSARIRISAKTLDGMGELSEALYRSITGGERVEEAAIITRERHREHLVQAGNALQKTCESLEKGLSEEFLALDVSIAMDQLGAILGKTYADDLLDQIFGQFCIGK